MSCQCGVMVGTRGRDAAGKSRDPVDSDSCRGQSKLRGSRRVIDVSD